MFQNNREYFLELVKNNSCTLKYASNEFRNDKNIVLEAI